MEKRLTVVATDDVELLINFDHGLAPALLRSAVRAMVGRMHGVHEVSVLDKGELGYLSPKHSLNLNYYQLHLADFY